ncbi:uncharacterized protein PG986_012817 [Apiospora aurea]|uniref:N-acetyltransferase domain-containing protein n=1 Tax=Apiospora aurea TaxID=335848 RepID=A0ABR1Q1I6_9PEZI
MDPPLPYREHLLFVIADPLEIYTAVASLEVMVEVDSLTRNAHLANLLVAREHRCEDLGFTLLHMAVSCVLRYWDCQFFSALAQAGKPAYRLYERMGF